MSKRNISVRRHSRRLPSGRRTSVIKHKRRIEGKLFEPSRFKLLGAFGEIKTPAEERKEKAKLGIAERVLLEGGSFLPPPTQAELRRDIREIKKKKGIIKAFDESFLPVEKDLLKLRKLEKKFGRIPSFGIGNIDIENEKGSAIAFDFKNKKFVKIVLTKKGFHQVPILKKRKG